MEEKNWERDIMSDAKAMFHTVKIKTKCSSNTKEVNQYYKVQQILK